MADVKLKHTGAQIDAQVDRVIDGSVVEDNTLSALDTTSKKPVNSEGIARAIETASNSLKKRGYIYMGVATPTTTPDVSGGKVFYLAAQAGEYKKFDATIANDALFSLEWNGERWSAIRIADLVTPAEVEDISNSLTVTYTHRIPKTAIEIGKGSIRAMRANTGVWNQLFKASAYIEPQFNVGKYTITRQGQTIWFDKDETPGMVAPDHYFFTQSYLTFLEGHRYLIKFGYDRGSASFDSGCIMTIDGKTDNLQRLAFDTFIYSPPSTVTPNFISFKVWFYDNESAYKYSLTPQIFDLTLGGYEEVTDNMELNNLFPDSYPYNKGAIAMEASYIKVGERLSPLDISQYFPHGLASAGKVYDEIRGKDVIRRVGAIKFSQLTFGNAGNFTYSAPISGVANMKKVALGQNMDNISAIKYVTKSGASLPHRMRILGETLYVVDTDYTSLEDFVEATKDMLLYYELNAPIITTLPAEYNIPFVVEEGDTLSFDVDTVPIIAEYAILRSSIGSDVKDSMDYAKAMISISRPPLISLPIPRLCAKVNITSPTGLAETKKDDKKCELEYWDKDGNYFKKWVVLNAQGSSSMAYEEKNQSIDIYNDEGCTEACEVQFGHWVAQDSFHLKCYYIDVFRGISNVCYKLAEQCIQHLGLRTNRLAYNKESITTTTSTGNFFADFNDGALCHPDGFPFEMYVNGDYYGMFVWNLKKHRANYSMKKDDYEAIILDGLLGDDTFWYNLDWTSFEIRNPGELITMAGEMYDGESPKELIDSTSSAWDASNAVHINTAKTKQIILNLVGAIARLNKTTTDEEKVVIFEELFDVDALILYDLLSNLIYHYDGYRKNWMWTIYNGKAAPNIYDCDSVFGRDWTGVRVIPDSLIKPSSIHSMLRSEITSYCVVAYKDKYKAIYAKLRKAGIFDVDNIMRGVVEWINRCGVDALHRNIQAWPMTPSYRASDTPAYAGTPAGGMYDSPERIRKWLEVRLVIMDELLDYAVE